MGLGAIRCEGYSGVLEAQKSRERISADDFSLSESAKEKLIYAAAIGGAVAWSGYWIMSTPTYSEMCGHTNNQSNATGNVTAHEDLRCKKGDDDGVAIPPLLYAAHYP